MECHDCGKECGDDEKLYLHSQCHPQDPTWAILDRGKDELEIVCAVCRKIICKFKVSPLMPNGSHSSNI